MDARLGLRRHLRREPRRRGRESGLTEHDCDRLAHPAVTSLRYYRDVLSWTHTPDRRPARDHGRTAKARATGLTALSRPSHTPSRHRAGRLAHRQPHRSTGPPCPVSGRRAERLGGDDHARWASTPRCMQVTDSLGRDERAGDAHLHRATQARGDRADAGIGPLRLRDSAQPQRRSRPPRPRCSSAAARGWTRSRPHRSRTSSRGPVLLAYRTSLPRTLSAELTRLGVKQDHHRRRHRRRLVVVDGARSRSATR